MSRKKQQERFLRTKVPEDMSLNKYLSKPLPLLCLSCHLAILKKIRKMILLNQVAYLLKKLM